MSEETVKFKIEPIEEQSKLPASGAEENSPRKAEEAADNFPAGEGVAPVSEAAPEAEKEACRDYSSAAAESPAVAEALTESGSAPVKNSSMTENRETFAPNFEKKGYRKEWLVTGLMAVLLVVGVVLAVLVERYQFAGIVIAVLSVLAAAAMVRHIFVSEKVLKLVGERDKVYLDELMKEMKRTKKPEFIREITALIKEGHLTGYALMNDIYLEKRSR